MSIQILQEKIRTRKNPIVLSIEPAPNLIPPFLYEECDTLAQCYDRFCRGLLESLAGILPGVRFCLSSFLALGPDGFRILPPLMAYAKALDYYVILDGLPEGWSEVGQSLAESVFGSNAFYPADSVMLNGYCGSDSMSFWLPYCKGGGKSMFVLAKSPNRSSVEIQDLYLGGRLVHTAMADLIGHWGSDGKMAGGYTDVGAVVGAPYPESIRNLREKYTRMFLLVTGVDSSRASPKKCVPAFDRFGHGAAVCAGNSILGAWRAEGADGRDYPEKAKEAVQKLLKNLNRYMTIL